MWLVARSVLGLCTAVLLCGTAVFAQAQEAEEDLRLETDTAVEEEVAPVPPARSTPITIGDDDDLPKARRRQSAEEAYAAQGIGDGPLLAFPSLEVGSVISTNPRRDARTTDVDAALRVKPRVAVQSDWARHSLDGAAEVEFEQFVGDTDLRSAEGKADLNLRLDVRRTTSTEFGLNYEATQADTGDDALDAADDFAVDHVLGGTAGVTHDFGGIEGRLRGGVLRRWFSDVELSGGGTEDNSDRNVTELSLAARGTLRTGAKIEPFAEIAYEPRVFDKTRDRNGIKRNSQGLRLSAGVNFNDDPIWSGEIAATMEMRDYSDSTLDTEFAPGVVANVTWRPSDLTRFEFNAGASLQDTVAAGISGTREWTLGYAASHALRENLELTGGQSFQLEESSGDLDFTFTQALGLNWTLNPYVVMSAGYEGTLFVGNGSGDDYMDYRVITSVILRR